MTQNEIAQIIKFSILKKCNDLAFPITITSGSDLQKTTVDFPSNKLIKQNDAICIDIGAIYQGFYSDRENKKPPPHTAMGVLFYLYINFCFLLSVFPIEQIAP